MLTHESRQPASWLIFDVGRYPLLWAVRESEIGEGKRESMSDAGAGKVTMQWCLRPSADERSGVMETGSLGSLTQLESQQ